MRYLIVTAVWVLWPATARERIEHAGVTLEFSLEALDGGSPRAGSLVELRLAAHDTRTGQPVTGTHASAFMLTRPEDPQAIDYPCEEKVRRRMVSHMGSRGDVSFNGYLVLSLNRDATVSFMNPLVNPPSGTVETVVSLPGEGYDWGLTPDGKWLLVTIPSRRAIALIDVGCRRLERLIAMPVPGVPGRILIERDGRRAWVGLDGGGTVIALDTVKGEPQAIVPTGPGRHELASNGDFLYVTNSAGESVTVVECRTGRVVTQIAAPGAPGPVAFDQASQYFYFASVAEGAVSVVDLARHSVIRKFRLKPGITALAFPPEGRFAWLANPVAQTVTVIDTAVQTITAETTLDEEPAGVAFGERFAYVYGRKSGKISVFGLSGAARDAFGRAPAQVNVAGGPASRVAVAPGGLWLFVASTAGTLLESDEELRSPATQLDNAGRIPLAVMVADRSLKETEPGIYRANLMLHWGGLFDVAVLVDNLQHCFRVPVEGAVDPEARMKWPKIRVPRILSAERIKASQNERLQIAIEDLAGRPVLHISDISLLICDRAGTHQQWVRPVHAGGGIFEAPVRFEAPGIYTVLLLSRSQGAAAPLPFAELAVQGGNE